MIGEGGGGLCLEVSRRASFQWESGYSPCQESGVGLESHDADPYRSSVAGEVPEKVLR